MSLVEEKNQRAKVALFVTCLVDLYRPSVGFASAELLKRAGFEVIVPKGQTCCGQPAYNAGARESAQKLARQNIDLLENFEHVVIPSGSCAGMLVKHYPILLEDDALYAAKARLLAGRVQELTQFLSKHPPSHVDQGRHGESVVYHPSCSCLRELKYPVTPPDLLAKTGLQSVPLARADVCCGFGGGFSVKYSDVSGAMAGKKCASIRETNADILVSADLGCLLHLAGRLKREGSSIEVRHIAEVLADQQARAAIGESGK